MKTEIEIPIYDRLVTVYYGKDTSDVVEDYPEIEDYLWEVEQSFYAQNEDTHLIYFQKDYATMHTIAHEIFHCTMGIARDVGLEYTEESEEAFAYLHGYLYTEVARWAIDNELVFT